MPLVGWTSRQKPSIILLKHVFFFLSSPPSEKGVWAPKTSSEAEQVPVHRGVYTTNNYS